jgi:putative ABC transport system substrate-binding protein
MYPNRDYIEVEGLMAYMPTFADYLGLVAHYVDRILSGTKPGDLPFQQPSVWTLIVNLRSARALDLTIPPELLVLADEVIE